MSRRDTIIIAVLLNTGLLAILFFMAVNPDDDRISDKLDIQQSLVDNYNEPQRQVESEQIILSHQTRQAPADEVDDVLKDFAATMQNENIQKSDGMYTSVQTQPRDSVSTTVEPVQKNSQYQQTSAKQQQPQKQDYIEVTVKQGDFLGKIAHVNGTTIEAIKSANNLQSDRLHIGQVLKIPVGTKRPAAATTASKGPVSQADDKDSKYYTVQAGDNPWKIAKKFHISVNDLLKMNQLDEQKARNLKPGDRIKVGG